MSILESGLEIKSVFSQHPFAKLGVNSGYPLDSSDFTEPLSSLCDYEPVHRRSVLPRGKEPGSWNIVLAQQTLNCLIIKS